jgi:hypothetical protein
LSISKGSSDEILTEERLLFNLPVLVYAEEITVSFAYNIDFNFPVLETDILYVLSFTNTPDPSIEVNIPLITHVEVLYFEANEGHQSYAPNISIGMPDLVAADHLYITSVLNEDLLFISGIQSALAIGISNCPYLFNCHAEVVCSLIAESPEDVIIFGNAEGCASGSEVALACGISVVTGVVFIDANCNALFDDGDIATDYPVI